MEINDKQNDDDTVRSLYRELLGSWNNHNAHEFADLFAKDGNVIGFDGSQINGRQEINDEISQIFSSHNVSSFIGIIREVRPLSGTVFVLRAVAGMFPVGEYKINP